MKNEGENVLSMSDLAVPVITKSRTLFSNFPTFLFFKLCGFFFVLGPVLGIFQSADSRSFTEPVPEIQRVNTNFIYLFIRLFVPLLVEPSTAHGHAVKGKKEVECSLPKYKIITFASMKKAWNYLSNFELLVISVIIPLRFLDFLVFSLFFFPLNSVWG